MIKNYEDFKGEILRLTDVNLNLYQEKQMKRRIETLISRLGLKNYEEYFHLLETDEKSLHYFLDYITINVSEFFRTPQQWHVMEEEALSDLFKRKKTIKAWCAACADGEEPYSLIMSVLEKYPDNDIKVLATDIDEEVLEKAEKGIYTQKQTEGVPQELLDKYFTYDGTSYTAKEILKSRVVFLKLDLLKFDYPKNMDLILVRNVLIYFTGDAKNEAYWKFHESLSDGGYLFMGSTEQIIYYKEFELEKIRPFLYRK